MPDATPWRAWLGAAASIGVPPSLFWRLSLSEWRALIAPPRAAMLTRADFETLAATYPDQT